jgi:hypothetical protein
MSMADKIDIHPMLNDLIKTAINTERDTIKFDNGNFTAGKRVRKNMQKIRRVAKSIRDGIQDEKERRRAVKKAQTG